jgi:polyisoprenoid-binding protein YceI
MTRLPILTLALLLATGAAHAQQPGRLAVLDASRLWIEGSTNMGGWRCNARTFDAVVATASSAPSSRLQRIDVTVVVRALKCGNPMMDRDLYAALGAGDRRDSSRITGRFDVVAQAAEVDTLLQSRGSLSVAGVERSVTMAIRTERRADGSLRATGSLPVKMTDFGVTPPTPVLGVVRTRDEIVVRFDLVLRPEAVQGIVGSGGRVP